MDENICISAMPAPAVGPAHDFVIQLSSKTCRLMNNFLPSDTMMVMIYLEWHSADRKKERKKEIPYKKGKAEDIICPCGV